MNGLGLYHADNQGRLPSKTTRNGGSHATLTVCQGKGVMFEPPVTIDRYRGGNVCFNSRCTGRRKIYRYGPSQASHNGEKRGLASPDGKLRITGHYPVLRTIDQPPSILHCTARTVLRQALHRQLKNHVWSPSSRPLPFSTRSSPLTSSHEA